MRVLVTGLSGRVGRLTVRRLLDRGDDVTGLDQAAPVIEDPGFRAVQGSLDDPAAVAEAVLGAEAVLHLGAHMSWEEAQADAVFRANVTGTYTLLQAVSRQPLHRLVFASSGEVYPEVRPQSDPIDESHPTNPVSLYGLTKTLGEQMVRSYAQRFGIPSCILRFSHTQDAEELLDPDSFFSGPRFFLHARIRQQERFGNRKVADFLRPLDDGTERLLLSRGEDGRPFRMTICDTRDLVTGILLALDHPGAAGETFNLHPNEAVSFDVLVPLISRMTNLPVCDVALPQSAVSYATSNRRIRERLDFQPQYPIQAMLAEAMAARRRRSTAAPKGVSTRQ